jgi:erythromycin esterase
MPSKSRNRIVNKISEQAIPLATDSPTGESHDLTSLEPIFQGARVIGLGESTHGTREFFRTKHRLIDFIARGKRPTIFAIEAPMVQARALNEYVLGGNGDARKLLRSLNYWVWDTEEMLHLIRWMRDFNSGGTGTIEFWGFDPAFPFLAVGAVRNFVRRVDPESLAAVTKAYRRLSDVFVRGTYTTGIRRSEWCTVAQSVVDRLQENESSYKQVLGDREMKWGLQAARLVLQAASPEERDASMAANVFWLLDYFGSGVQVILWAHNEHIQRSPGRLGQFLTDRLGPAYFPVGLFFGEGRVTAIGPQGLGSYACPAPGPKDLEHTLRASGIPRFALALKDHTGDPHLSFGTRTFRAIGSVFLDNHCVRGDVEKLFDAVIYIDSTLPSRVNRSRAGA